jgi:hypothetical protein
MGKCSVSASSSASEFPAEGGEGRITVTAARDCGWQVRTDASWITVASSGVAQGNGTASFTVAGTSDPVTRSASLSIVDQQIAITQRGAPCTYRFSRQELTIPSAGGGADVDVTASSPLCEWTARTTADWATIRTGTSYKGNARVTVEAPAWSGPTRHAEITVAGQRLTLTQSDGCVFTLATPSATMPAAGGRGSVSVQAGQGCGWSAVSNVSWATITAGTTATGPGVAEFSISTNTGPERSGTLTIANKPFAITQAAGCDYHLDSAGATFQPSGGSGTITMNVASGCSWSAVSDASWISITAGTTGNGTGTIAIAVSPNSGPQRTGTVSAGGQRYTVTQLTGCTYSIDPVTWGFPAAGAADWINVHAPAACPWTATSQASWLTITNGTAGTGSALVYFVVAPNPSGPRSGTLTVAGITFTALQSGN